jgi:hypothetical protein
MNTVAIKPVKLGLPSKQANRILVRPIIYSTQALDCNTYYEVISRVVTLRPSEIEGDEPTESIAEETLATGNIAITEEQYAAWGKDNAFIEDIVIAALGLERETTEAL